MNDCKYVIKNEEGEKYCGKVDWPYRCLGYLACREYTDGKDSSESETKPDMVNHPPHYKSKKGLEVIDVIEAFCCDLKGIEATDTGNVIKYILRWKNKNGIEDLKKADWYLNHLINHLENRKGE